MNRRLGLFAVVSVFWAVSAMLCQEPSPSQPLSPDDEEVHEHLMGEIPVIRIDFSKFARLESIGVVPVQLRVDEKGAVLSAEVDGYDEADTDGFSKRQREVLKNIVEEAQKISADLRFRPFEVNGRAVPANFEIEIPLRGLEEPPVKHISLPPIRDFNSVRIVLERTGCFGSCPSYKVEVHGDGTVLYRGGMFVAITGEHRATISQDAVLQMVEAGSEADYFSLKDRYVLGATDLPTYTTSISVDGKTKSIVDYAGRQVGMPESVSKLEEAIDRLSGVDRWTKGNGETVPALMQERFDFSSSQASEIMTNVTEKGNAEAVRDLIMAGVVVSPKPTEGAFHQPTTAFDNAAFRGDVEMLNALLGAGFNDPQTLTEALERAASAGKLEAMHLLIQHGANPNAPTVLIGTARSGVPAAVLEILKFRPDVNARGQDNTTALAASLQGYHYKVPDADVKKVVDILLKAGADPNLANDEGKTPLMLNAMDLEIAEMLVAHGANVNAPAKNGFTPLLNAGTMELTRFLLKHGADPFAKDEHGETALDWAKMMNRPDQAALLEAAMTGMKQ